MMLDQSDEDLPTFAILRQRAISLAHQRGSENTFCPSEVARSFGSYWRDLMPRVHQVAQQLCCEGQLEYNKGGISHGQNRPSGAYRLRLVAGKGN